MKSFKEFLFEDFYYISGDKGMTSSGSFTSDKNKWITFTKDDIEKFKSSGKKPYGSTKNGMFVDTNKY